METFESRTFAKPDETLSMEKTTIELVGLAGGEIQRTTFQRGWRWTEAVRPIAGTDLCEVDHLAYVVSGRLHADHEDGSAGDVTAGDVFRLAPGHDAWVVGDEPVVLIEFQGIRDAAGG